MIRRLRNDRIRNYEAKYREKMHGWVSRLKNKHRVKLKGLDGDFSVKQWKKLVIKHKHRCVICGKKRKLTYDHIVPLSEWREWTEKNHPSYRANDIENLQPLCLECNSRKGKH